MLRYFDILALSLNTNPTTPDDKIYPTPYLSDQSRWAIISYSWSIGYLLGLPSTSDLDLLIFDLVLWFESCFVLEELLPNLNVRRFRLLTVGFSYCWKCFGLIWWKEVLLLSLDTFYFRLAIDSLFDFYFFKLLNLLGNTAS